MYVYKSVAESGVTNTAYRVISLVAQDCAVAEGGEAPVSPRGAFVPEVLKTVWTMCWIRWYDCVSCAFRAFFGDEKESRIKGWRRNRRSAQSLLPAVRAVDGGFNAVGCGAFCERFQSGWRLSSRKRRCSKDFGGALWPFLEKTEVITSLKTGSARRAYFAPL